MALGLLSLFANASVDPRDAYSSNASKSSSASKSSDKSSKSFKSPSSHRGSKDYRLSRFTTRKATFQDYIAIKNKLATYVLAIDTKQWSLLDDVFLPDVQADYPFLEGHVVGVEALTCLLKEKMAATANSHHALTSQTMEFSPDCTRATVMTYFNGTYFGAGVMHGEHARGFGKYIDELVRIGEDDWKIAKRNTFFMGFTGNVEIFEDRAPPLEYISPFAATTTTSLIYSDGR